MGEVSGRQRRWAIVKVPSKALPVDFESVVFLPVKSMAVWMPFQEALFYLRRMQRDRQVAISAKEVYACVGNKWIYRTALTTEAGSC